MAAPQAARVLSLSAYVIIKVSEFPNYTQVYDAWRHLPYCAMC